MKNAILIISLMFSSLMISQGYGYKYSTRDRSDYVYLNGSFDMNMAFGIKDNPGTIGFNDRGFDFDLELGARDNHIGIYVFYGKFDRLNYQNYGAGVDYYAPWLRETHVGFYNPFSGNYVEMINGIDMSIGGAYGVIIKHNNHAFGGSHFRLVSTLWFGENIGFTMRFQFTKAGDLPEKTFRKEGAIGITYKFDR